MQKTADNEKAEKYGQTAVALASSIAYNMGEVNARQTLIDIFFKQKNYPKVIEQAEMVLENRDEYEDFES